MHVTPDYNYLRELCQKQSTVSTPVIDEWIIYYAAKRDKLDQEFDTRLSRFKHAAKEMGEAWINMIKMQYIAHRIFKSNGLIGKYLNHVAVRDRDTREQAYLNKMATTSWHFSYSVLKANPSIDFYEMEDVFTGEVYLLYSRSVTQLISKGPKSLWFNLIGFNGYCWETFGPIGSFQCFDADDIFFYATELNHSIATVADLLKDLENNPVPYVMLITGSLYPLIKQDGFEMVQVIGESYLSSFDVELLKKSFKVAYADGVFKLTDKILGESPHYAEAYFEEEEGAVVLVALTDHGYLEMAKLLNMFDFRIPAEPDFRLHLPMLELSETLLRRKINLNPYRKLFTTPGYDEDNEKLNKLLSLAMPFINSGQDADVDALAKEAGVDPETAKALIEHTMGRLRKLG